MPAPTAQTAALEPPRAYGEPLAAAQLRAVPEDFVVEEELGFPPAGAGQHLLLRVRKRGANTQWVARELARLAGCRAADVGYAGLKDRRAVATQWFSVPQPRRPVDWPGVGHADFEVLAAHAHDRKLPRGALAANRFVVRLRTVDGDEPALRDRIGPRLEQIACRGVPNYFGPQRFGRAGANLAPSAEDLRRLPPAQRGFVLSAARSALFNAVLAARVADGSWDHLETGDLANLDGRGSVFAVEGTDDTLSERTRRLELHPTGPLWGEGAPATRGRILDLELQRAGALVRESALCSAAGMRQERRSLRLAVRELNCRSEPGALVLGFRLARGAFATAVLRELIATPPDGGA